MAAVHHSILEICQLMSPHNYRACSPANPTELALFRKFVYTGSNASLRAKVEIHKPRVSPVCTLTFLKCPYSEFRKFFSSEPNLTCKKYTLNDRMNRVLAFTLVLSFVLGCFAIQSGPSLVSKENNTAQDTEETSNTQLVFKVCRPLIG